MHLTNDGSGTVSLAWNSAAGAAGYNVYRSPVTGGGYVKVNGAPLAGPNFTDTGLRNAQNYYYVVTALDSAGNESAFSNEVNALPHLTIGWANLQWPPTLIHTIRVVNRTDNVYGQVWIDGATNQPGATESLRAQLEEVVRRIRGLGDEYEVIVDKAGNAETIRLRVEVLPEAQDQCSLIQSEMEDQLRLKTNLRYELEMCGCGTLPRYEVKAKRFKDLRGRPTE